jgi:D-threo-aldose 1-dehydrogenase
LNPADTAPIGRTGLRVSRLGFGSTVLAGMFESTSEADAQDAVNAAWEAGLRYFDTAPQYGGGTAERRLGAALRGRNRDEYVVSSKVGKLIRELPEGGAPTLFADAPPHEIVYDYSYDGTLRSLEATLARTGLERIDIALIHDVNRKYHGGRVMERLREALSGACVALRRLRDEGVIRAFGPAGNELDVTLRFLREADIDCLMLPQRWTLLDRSAGEELLPLCLERGVSVLAAAPFASGILATGAERGAMHDYGPAAAATLDRVRRLESTCARYDVPLPAAALQFPLLHPTVASVVVGVRRRAEVDLNLALLRSSLPDSLWMELEGISD